MIRDDLRIVEQDGELIIQQFFSLIEKDGNKLNNQWITVYNISKSSFVGGTNASRTNI